MDILQKKRIPAGSSLDNQPLVDDPQLNQRKFFIETEHPEVGRRQGTSLPWKTSRFSAPNIKYAPLLGEHNHYVFHDLLGLDEKEIATLENEKVIY
jgi:crotonobetainyl-CoA:carnitine CoA-transferase CaiB-like acyl-CoA transferase